VKCHQHNEQEKFIPHTDYQEYPVQEMRERSFYEDLNHLRTVRDFSDEIIEDCIRASCTASNGANQQPWHFVAVSDPAVKNKIREAAEKEEREFYERRDERGCSQLRFEKLLKKFSS
jgi:hypothetical protein